MKLLIIAKDGVLFKHSVYIIGMIKQFARSLFSIYPGEEKNAFQFAVLGFLWALAVSLGWKNADALFLLNVGAEHLPTAYAIIAGCMIGIAALMLYAYNQFAAHRIFLTLLACGAVFYSFIYLCLTNGWGIESKWLWYALRVFGWIFFCVVNTNFWTFIDQFYHLRDSKRLFCLFSSAVFVGVALTGVLMQSGLLEFRYTIALIIAILSLTAWWILRIVKNVQSIHSEHDIEQAPSPTDGTLRQTIAAIFQSKFTLFLMCLNFTIFVSVILTEYNYMVAFENRFGGGFEVPISNEEDAPLTLFLGQCIAFVNIFNILFGLFVYSRLVRRFGLTGMLLITPFLLVLTYAGWPFSDTLLFPLMAFFVSESTFYVVDDNNFNLLLNGVPTKLKYKIRVFIESFFEPVGTLVSALLLSFMPGDARIVALGVALIVLGISLIVRFLYPKAISLNLMENAVHFEKTPKEWLPTLSKKERRASESKLLNLVKMGDHKQQEMALEGLIDFEDIAILPSLLTIIDHSPPETKQLFIQKLEFSPFKTNTQVVDLLSAWDQEGLDPTLRGTLHFYLAKQGLLSAQKALLDLKSLDPKLIGAGLIALRKSLALNNPYSAPELTSLSLEALQDLLESDEEQANWIGLQVLAVNSSPDDLNILIPYLHHSSILLAREAAKVISAIASPSLSEQAGALLKATCALTDNEVRLNLLKALGKMADTSLIYDIIEKSLHLRPNERRMIENIVYRMGLRTIPTLLSILKDTALHHRCRLLGGRILGRLALPQLRANLSPIIASEIDRAFFYFYHYHMLEIQPQERDLLLMKDALLTGYHSIMDFLIQLLGMGGEVEDAELLSRSLRSQNPKVRSQVVETIERTCETSLFRLLQPLVDELPLSEKLRMYKNPSLTLEELVAWLQGSPFLTDQIAAAAVSSSLNLPGWRKKLKIQMAGKEELFQHFAYELLEA